MRKRITALITLCAILLTLLPAYASAERADVAGNGEQSFPASPVVEQPNAAAPILVNEPEIQITGTPAEDAPDLTPDSALNGTCGDNATWELSDDYATLTIGGTGAVIDTCNYASVPWYPFSSMIKTIIVDEGITGVPCGIFNSCTGVEEIVLQICSQVPTGEVSVNNWTYINYHLGYLFGYNENWSEGYLSRVVFGISGGIPYRWTSRYFVIPLSLHKVTVKEGSVYPGFFSDCTMLSEIVLSENVNRICNLAFYGCTGLIKLSLTSGVTDILTTYGEYLYSTGRLSDTTPTAFTGCTQLSKIYYAGDRVSFQSISGIAPLNGKEIHFRIGGECGEASRWSLDYDDVLTISGYDSVTKMDYLAYFDVIQSVAIGPNISGLSNLYFSGLTSNTGFTVDPANQEYTVIGGNLCSKDGTKLIAAVAKDGIYTIPDSVNTIASYAFRNAAGDSLILKDVLMVIEVNAFSGASFGEICFKGTETQWDGVTVEDGNTALSQGSILFRKYPITYNLSGGKGSFDNQMKELRKDINLYSETPVREGYTFKGWATENGGKVAYHEGDIYSTDATLSLYAIWSLNSYTITFNGNGGGNTPVAQTKTHGTTFTLPAQKPTRAGYLFNGWSTSKTGEVLYTAGDSYTATASVTLYAVWSPIQYSITYHANGGNGVMAPTYHTYDIAACLSAQTFTRIGYTFRGWALTASGQPVYEDGQTITNATSVDGTNIDLYAVWDSNYYTVVFHANGGSGNIVRMSLACNTNYTLQENSFSRLGYTFAGWSTSESGPVTYTDKQLVRDLSMISGTTIDLYAVWNINTFTVSYSAPGASNIPAFQTKEYGKGLVLSSQIPTKTGYTFAGWALSAQDAASYNCGDTYYNNAAVTLYATWIGNVYEVSYHSNGGSGTMPDSQFTYDCTGALRESAFTKTGYVFTGWSNSEDGTFVYENCASVCNLASVDGAVVDLYAIWQPIQYFIKYDANGGVGTMQSSTLEYNKEAALSTCAFYRTGYTFTGWKVNKADSVAYAEKATVTNLTSTNNAVITLFAAWQKNTYHVIYNANGGEGSAMEVSEFTYDTVETTRTVSYTRTGFHFLGWSLEKNSAAICKNGGTVLNLTGEPGGTVTLYAVWEIDTFTVSYDANGGMNAPEVQKKNYGENITLSSVRPVRPGYAFAGWTNTQSGQVAFQPGDAYTANAAVALFAVWNPNSYTVLYDANGGSGSMVSSVFKYDTSYYLPKNLFSNSKHTFVGWSVSPKGDSLYKDQQTVQSLTSEKDGTITLYAIWAPIPVQSVSINKASVTMVAMDTLELTASVKPENATNPTVYWTSSDDNIASVAAGKIVARSAGTVTISAISVDGNRTATCTVTVNPLIIESVKSPVSSISEGIVEKNTKIILSSPTLDSVIHYTTDGTVPNKLSPIYTETISITQTTLIRAFAEKEDMTDSPEVSFLFTVKDPLAPTLVVDSVQGKIGQSVDVNIWLNNNPGIFCLGFEVGYDHTAMELTKISAGDIFTQEEIDGNIARIPFLVNACTSGSNRNASGKLVTLTFNLKGTCASGEYPITLHNVEAVNQAEAHVTLGTESGIVTANSVVFGDITGDNVVNRLDLIRMIKYFSGYPVTINEVATDVNDDGTIDRLDLTRLAKYFAGYDVTLGKK